MKFMYHLTVGVCRSNPISPRSSVQQKRSGTEPSTSQVMRVPIRVYNHVSLSASHEPYDIIRPVLHSKGRRDQKSSARVKEIVDAGSPSSPSGATWGSQRSLSGLSMDPARTVNVLVQEPGRDSKGELKDYALRLLASTSSDEPQLLLPASHGDESVDPDGKTTADDGEGEPTDCREAVEVLTRNMRKGIFGPSFVKHLLIKFTVSYDVNKDGLKVAVLTFTKSAYRLGETIIGIVELNDISSRARVLKVRANFLVFPPTEL